MIAPALERFWSRVHRTDTCWLWTGKPRADGYGRIRDNGRDLAAHRFAFEQFVGTIPPGMLVCHRCDTPLCVNPEHLFAGTAADNAHDRDAKGRYINPRWSQTHCRRGHPLSGDNLRLELGGRARRCRQCARDGANARNAKRRSS